MKRPRKSPRGSGTTVAEATSEPMSDAGLPSERVRMMLSIWVPIHLFALLLSLAAVVEPSSLHARLLDLMRPYLQLTHFGVDDRPLYLAYGNPSEQPHRLEVTETPIQHHGESAKWINPHFRAGDESQLTIVSGLAAKPGLAVSDRYARWLATAATLADTEQPSLVGELLLPVVEADETVRGIRILRRPTDLSATVETVETPYLARVVRSGDSTSLVQLRSDRFNAIAQPQPEQVDE